MLILLEEPYAAIGCLALELVALRLLVRQLDGVCRHTDIDNQSIIACSVVWW